MARIKIPCATTARINGSVEFQSVKLQNESHKNLQRMVVQEVRNETFQTEEREKKRKRVKAKRTRQEDRVLVEPALAPKNVRISEYISNSTNVKHKIYRDILINRRNGERVTVLNQLK